jgi:hypothetical protein
MTVMKLLLALLGALVAGVAVIAVRAWIIRLAAPRVDPHAPPIFPAVTDADFHDVSGPFNAFNRLTPEPPTGSEWTGIAIHGPKQALIEPGHNVVIAGYRCLDLALAQRADKELRLVFIHMGTQERGEMLVDILEHASPRWVTYDERGRPPPRPSPSDWEGTVGTPFLINLSLLRLGGGDYRFFVRLDDLRSNELQISVTKRGQ